MHSSGFCLTNQMRKKKKKRKRRKNPFWISIMLDKNALLNFNKEMENLQIFSLCKEFDELSLSEKEEKIPNDIGPSSSYPKMLQYSASVLRPLSTSYHALNLHSFTPSLSPWLQAFIENLRAPFVDLPHHLFQEYDIKMGIGFRFLPGQSDFLFNELKFPSAPWSF